ncbi:MAG: hypothetical protein EOP88_21260, partial [Verrucomicrobiaceae bacterium]
MAREAVAPPVRHGKPVPGKNTIWRKLGGGALAFSIAFHIVLLVIALIRVFQQIPAPESGPDFLSSPGGGGSPVAEMEARRHRVRFIPPVTTRAAAVDVHSRIALPEPEKLALLSGTKAFSSVGQVGGMAGLGGSGSGGGLGGGHSTGFGDGIGSGGARATGPNPFGMLEDNGNSLVGTFYDLKQTATGEPTDLTVDQIVTILNGFTNGGWNESTFEPYFKAPRPLYQTRLYIPAMPAAGAPWAFRCADKVQPSRWAIVYRGVVSPPKTGKYRFVGSGDDILVVRFNGRNVFDHGYYSGTTEVRTHESFPVMKGEATDPEVVKLLAANYPMDQPLRTYQYATTKDWNRTVGGVGVGPVFEAEAGKSYPIDILLSELPGHLFCAALLIQDVGAEYDSTSNACPI